MKILFVTLRLFPNGRQEILKGAIKTIQTVPSLIILKVERHDSAGN